MTQHETDLGVRALEKAQQTATDARHLSNQRQDRIIRLLLFAVAVVTIATLIVGLLSFPVLTTGSDAAQATQESGELTACRSAYNVLVVEATGRLDDASRKVDLLTNEVLQAVLQDDQATIDEDLPLIPFARRDVEQRNKERDQAVQTYRVAVKRSGDDPKGFLADCRDHPPI